MTKIQNQAEFDGGQVKLDQNSKRYDLEERTIIFAKRIRNFIKSLTRTIAVIEDGKQLIRSSGSVGANYIEANEALGKKDFLMKIKICRKEAKESAYWLELIESKGEKEDLEKKELLQEAKELMMIFTAIMRKSQ